jgi:hypothetical protein
MGQSSELVDPFLQGEDGFSPSLYDFDTSETGTLI